MDLNASTDLCRALSDGARRRLFALVSREELGVHELCEVTGLPQPRVSTHLAALLRAGLVSRRQSGRRAFFRRAALEPATAAFVAALDAGTQDPALATDAARLEQLLAGPRTWPATVAGEMERHYSPGRTWEAMTKGLVGLTRLGAVLDIGAGDGFVAALLAPRAREVVCVERDPEVADAAERRLAAFEHVEVQRADAHALPFEAQRFDAVLLMNSLCFMDDPARVVREAGRVLRPGGALTLVTLAAHAHLDETVRFGHVHAGFTDEAIEAMLADAGLETGLCAVTQRERRAPHFEVLTAHGTRAT
jgi:ArsR family transcriptional regulator